MPTIAEFRAGLGPDGDRYTDEQLYNAAKATFGSLYSDPKQFDKELGYEPENDFGRGLRIAGRNTLAAGGGAVAALADTFGATGVRDSALAYGRGQQQQAIRMGRRSDDVDNFMEDPLSFLSAGAGQAIGYALPSVASGGVGALAARGLGMSALAGAGVGSYASNFAQQTGGIYNELAEKGIYDPGRAAAFGAGTAALDTAAELTGLGRFAKGAGGLRGVRNAVLTQAPMEAGTELLQTVGERQAAYKPITGEEANKEYRNAAALGALGGGMFGAATGWAGQRELPQEEAPPTIDQGQQSGRGTDLLQLGYTAPANTSRELALQGERGLSEREGEFTDVTQIANPPNQIGANPAPLQLGLTQPAQNALVVNSGGTIAPAGASFSGLQRDMFGGTEIYGTNEPTQVEGEQEVSYPDTRTGDMLQQRPSAMLPTMFNPTTEPNYDPTRPVGAAASTLDGGVVGNIRSELKQLVGNDYHEPAAVTLAFDFARSVGNADAMQGSLDARRKTLQSAQKKLDNEVESGKKNPEEYAVARKQLERKAMTLEAGQEIINRTRAATVRAYADEAGNSQRPGSTTDSTRSPTRGTERTMRDSNMGAAVADTDSRVQGAQEQKTAKDRADVLANVLSDKATINPLRRFQKALRDMGYAAPLATEAEKATIAKAKDVKAAMKQPPWLAKLTPRDSLDEGTPDVTQAAQTQQAKAQEPAAPAAVSAPALAVQTAPAPVAPNGSVADVPGGRPGKRSAAVSPDAGGSVADSGRNTAPAVGAVAAPAGVATDAQPAGVVADGKAGVVADAVAADLDAKFEAADEAFTEASDALSVATKKVERAERKRDKLDNSLATDDPKRINAIEKLEQVKAEYTEVLQAAGDAAEKRREAKVNQSVAQARARVAPQPAAVAAAPAPAPVAKAAAPAPAPAPKAAPSYVKTAEAMVSDALETEADALAALRKSYEMKDARKTDAATKTYMDAGAAVVRAKKKLREAEARAASAKAEVQESSAAVTSALDAVSAAPAPAPKKQTASERKQQVDAGLADLDAALVTYNSPGPEQGVAATQAHIKKVGEAAAYIREVADDTGESPKVRKYAKKLLDDEIDPADVRWSSGPTLPPTTNKGPQPTLAQIQNLVEKLFGYAKSTLPITVVKNPAEVNGIPIDTLPAGATPMGAVFGGRIYLFADNIPSIGQAKLTLFHELFHYGLQKVLAPGEYANILRRFANDPAVAAYVARWKDSPEGRFKQPTMEPGEYEVLANEEALADISENIIEANGVGTKRGPLMRAVLRYLSEAANALRLYGVSEFIRKLTRTRAEQFVIDMTNAAMGGPKQLAKKQRQFGGTASGTVAGGKFSANRSGPETSADSSLNEAIDRAIPAPDQYTKGASLINEVRSRLGNWMNSPGVLGLLSRRQMADVFKNVAGVGVFDDLISRQQAAVNKRINKSHKHATRWSKLKAAEQTQLGLSMLNSSLGEAHVDIDLSADKAWASDMNKHLRTGDAAAQAAARTEFNKVHAEFHKMSAVQKQLYQDIKADMAEQWKDISDLRLQSLIEAYATDVGTDMPTLMALVRGKKTEREAFRKKLKDSGASMAAQRAYSRMVQDAADHFREAGTLQGPYFPLVRNGEHIVVMKSTSLQQAQKAFAAARDVLQKLYEQDTPTDTDGLKAYEEKVDAANTVIREMRKRVEELKAQDVHYQVTFFEKHWEAARYEKKLADKFKDDDNIQVKLEQRTEHFRQMDGATPQFIQQIESKLAQSLPQAEAAKVKAALRDVYLQSLPDRSALKSEIRRLQVRGARADEMMRGYATRSIGNAHRASRMEYSKRISDAVNDLRFSEDREEKVLGGELAKRMVQNMVLPERNAATAAIGNAASISNIWHLGMAPAYWITNGSQPWVISVPIMAAKHGIRRSGAAMYQATKEVAAVANLARKAMKAEMEGDALAGWKSLQIEINPDTLGKTDDERAMLRELFDTGRLDINVKHMLGSLSTGESEGWISKAAEIASAPAQMIEAVNRVATALAAFRLEVSNSNGRDQKQLLKDATDYAGWVVSNTHFDYAEENAPRLMRSDTLGGLGRLVFQFKKYAQSMLYLQTKLFMDGKVHRMFMGEKATTTEMKEARKAFMYLNAATVAVAGSAGLIGAPVVKGLLYAAQQMMGEDDDDEPELAQMSYNAVSDVSPTLARLVFNGVPAALGFNLSSMMGQGDAMNPFAFTDTAKEGKDLFANALMSLAGPAAGIGASFFEAGKNFGDDPYKAVFQTAAPRAIRNVFQAFSRAQEDDPSTPQQEGGVASRSGASVVKNDELNGLDIFMKGLGLETSLVKERQENRAASLNLDKRLMDTRKRLMKDWTPGDGMPDEVKEFNARNPNSKIEYKDLRSSFKARQREQKETVDGVRVRARSEDLVDQL